MPRRYNHHGKPKARQEVALQNLKYRLSNGTTSSITGYGRTLTDEDREKIKAQIEILEGKIGRAA